LDIALVEKLVALLHESAVSEVQVSAGELTVRVRRGAPVPQGEYPVSEESTATEGQGPEEGPGAGAGEPEGTLIRAGMVGIFHQVDGILPGAEVRAGQTLGLIQSMKLMNEVKCPAAGVVREVFVEDGSPVEYGQQLFAITEAEAT
jgi:acetyl-CoA carboxylase biotin carboxyl carrier protein